MANERRLIDVEELVKSTIEFCDEFQVDWSTNKVLAWVNNAPTVNAVEVVRCGECRWRGSENCAMFYRCDCGEQHTWETDNDFCSYGERRGK